MAEIVRTLNLTATFAAMKVGDIVEIGIHDATESNVRTAASRFAKDKKIELRVSVPRGAGAITVKRIS